MQNFFKIHPRDNVAVALRPLAAGTALAVDGARVVLTQGIPQGHKFALADIPAGGRVVKYGAPIGAATAKIPAGAWVHTHNLKTGLHGLLDYAYRKTAVPLQPTPPRAFQGFCRGDGRVGVRNEIWIIPTVGCVNSLAAAVAQAAQPYQAGTVGGIVAFSHPYGCSQLGEDQENTRRALAGLIRHPNAGGVLVLGLGCENSGIDVLKPYLGDYDPKRVRFLEAQQARDEMAEALAAVRDLCAYAGAFSREPVPCSKLVVGLKCGGSDGLSGITANPVVGGFSDLLLSMGGTAILTEVPEMFGAETLLMDRCADRAIFEKTVALINGFKEFFQANRQPVYENPSPGNKAGGITTLEEKSMGCVQKSGAAPVEGVLAYGEPVRARGLHLLSAPGNDLVAATALAVSGAQVVLFTTGRGTPFAAPVPTVKISSNTALYERKKHWIDFDCGALTDGGSAPALSAKLLDAVLRAASGEPVKSETAGFHDMAIWKQGVTL